MLNCNCDCVEQVIDMTRLQIIYFFAVLFGVCDLCMSDVGTLSHQDSVGTLSCSLESLGTLSPSWTTVLFVNCRGKWHTLFHCGVCKIQIFFSGPEVPKSALNVEFRTLWVL